MSQLFDFDNLESELDGWYKPRLTEADQDHWTPAVDIHEDEKSYVLRADVPGVDPENIEVTAEQGYLTIKGERTRQPRGKTDTLKRVERTHGNFLRRFNLPDSADCDAISASSNHGVLEIMIAKKSEVQPRRISIKS